MYFDKLLLYYMALYTLVLINDCISIVIQEPSDGKTFFGS